MAPRALAAFALAGCATTGSTLGSGVGDTLVEHPPFYAGARPASLDPAADIGHFPIAYQPGASQDAIFDPPSSPALEGLLREMTAYLDSLAISARLVEGGRVSAVAHADTRFPPDVRFGCDTETGAPGDDCIDRGDEIVLGRDPQYLMLSVGRPSREWAAWAGQVMADNGVDYALVITLEIGQYWTRQRGLLGRKELELGTNHVVDFPWLTSLETPVSVLQLTGALVSPDGRAVRIGAEGMLARRTDLLVSSIGGQALIRDEDILELARARREDLPGKPLVWEAALRTMVRQLTGR